MTIGRKNTRPKQFRLTEVPKIFSDNRELFYRSEETLKKSFLKAPFCQFKVVSATYSSENELNKNRIGTLFLPTNVIFVIESMAHCVIQNIKLHYRKQFLIDGLDKEKILFNFYILQIWRKLATGQLLRGMIFRSKHELDFDVNSGLMLSQQSTPPPPKKYRSIK